MKGKDEWWVYHEWMSGPALRNISLYEWTVFKDSMKGRMNDECHEWTSALEEYLVVWMNSVQVLNEGKDEWWVPWMNERPWGISRCTNEQRSSTKWREGWMVSSMNEWAPCLEEYLVVWMDSVLESLVAGYLCLALQEALKKHTQKHENKMWCCFYIM